MPKRWKEREHAIMNGILSLLTNGNALDNIRHQGDQALYEAVACKVRPTLDVCAGEQQQFEADLNAVRQENAALRNAVETVIANQHTAPADNGIIMDALRKASPSHPFLKG